MTRFTVFDDPQSDEGTVGETTPSSMATAFEALTEGDGLQNIDRTFLDIGAGNGNAVFAAYNSGLFKSTWGIEYRAQGTFLAKSSIDIAGLSNDQNINVWMADAKEIFDLGRGTRRVTHVYTFSVGMDQSLKSHILELCYFTSSVSRLLIFMEKHEVPKGVEATVIKRFHLTRDKVWFSSF